MVSIRCQADPVVPSTLSIIRVVEIAIDQIVLPEHYYKFCGCQYLDKR